MKYAGIWWAMHLDQKTWNSGPRHGATTAEAKKIIDFAARNGLGGVLIEGWNVGWDGEWFGNGSDFSFTKPYPDFDLPGVVAYGRKKGVQLIGHHETGGNIANYEAQLGAAFDLNQSLGIDMRSRPAMSPTPAESGRWDADGKIHFEWHEGQVAVNHHSRSCAKRPSGRSRSTRTSRSRTPGFAAPIPTGSRAKASAGWNITPGACRKNPPK